MLTGNNHEALPVSTHGFLIGIEMEASVNIDQLLSRMVDSVSYLDGVGRVEAEHIGEMGDYATPEEEILAQLPDLPLKES